ncbi:nuclear protein Es2-domain-containing protein [Pelagophyceae sp. CCMP2097]|nr:nuclear protein Es2-domain-containing protein [Pelagophyceae sp. CCMP2097]
MSLLTAGTSRDRPVGCHLVAGAPVSGPDAAPFSDDDAVALRHAEPHKYRRKRAAVARPPLVRGATGVLLMPPPPPRLPPRARRILEEDEYLDRMRAIIERDYYPDLARLQGELEALPMSLDRFAANYTSEDNASFELRLAEDAREHVRKWWWAYDDLAKLKDAGVDVPDVSAPGKHVLSDGTRISAARRDRADAAADVQRVRGDERPSGLDFSGYEARSNLYFTPAGIEQARSEARLVGHNFRCVAGDALGPLKEIAKTNTRFRPPAVDRLDSPAGGWSEGSSSGYADLSEVSSLFSEPVRRPGTDLQRLVPMTPLIEPGGAEDPMVMTWGTLAARPIVLDDGDHDRAPKRSRGGASSAAPLREPGGNTHAEREALARALDERNRRRKRRAPPPSPLRQALDARRLASPLARSGVATPGKARRPSSALRDSYTPSRTPRPSPVTRRPGASTPLLSPRTPRAGSTPLPSPLSTPNSTPRRDFAPE